MSKKLALVFIHGMGSDTPEDINGYFMNDFANKIKKSLGADLTAKIHFDYLYYHDVITGSQTRLGEAYKQMKLPHSAARELFLTAFSDAVSVDLESNYSKIQARIANKLLMIKQNLDSDLNVIIIAHSLGAHVLNNYIWDAQMYDVAPERVSRGIWKKLPFNLNIPTFQINKTNKDFFQFKTLRGLFTIGCNLPILIAGKPAIQAIYTKDVGYSIAWKNFYDQNDILGWPLKPLGGSYSQDELGRSYTDSLEDFQVKTTQSLLPDIPLTWISHLNYLNNELDTQSSSSFRQQLLDQIRLVLT